MTVQRNLDRLSAVGCRKANLALWLYQPFRDEADVHIPWNQPRGGDCDVSPGRKPRVYGLTRRSSRGSGGDMFIKFRMEFYAFAACSSEPNGRKYCVPRIGSLTRRNNA